MMVSGDQIAIIFDGVSNLLDLIRASGDHGSFFFHSLSSAVQPVKNAIADINVQQEIRFIGVSGS